MIRSTQQPVFLIKTFARAVFLLCFLTPLTLLALTREEGLGDQGVAYPQTSFEARYNPAGITDVGDRLDLAGGMIYQHGYTTIKNVPAPLESYNQHESNSQAKWLPLGLIGISKSLSEHLSVALSTDNTRSGKSCTLSGFNYAGHGKFGVEVEIPILLPTVAWKVNSMHSIGLSVPLYIGRANVRGIQNLEALSVSPSNVSNKGYDYACTFGLNFGWLWHITPVLNFGLTYNTGSLASSHFRRYRGFFPKHGLLEISPSMKVGCACKINPRTHVSFQYECDFNQHNPTVANPSFSTAPFGSDESPGLGWKNANIYTLGADYLLFQDLQVRAGWTWLPRALVRSFNVASNTGDPVFVFKNFVLAGATWYCNCWEFGILVGYAPSNTVTSTDLPTLLGGQIQVEHSQLPFLISVAKKF